MAITTVYQKSTRNKLGNRVARDFTRYRYVYLMLLPVIAYYVIFCYFPMYGSFMAFEDYNLSKGIFGSPIASSYGFGNFIQFFTGLYFKRVVLNTLYLNFLSLVFGFPAPIIMALLINELRNKSFKRVVQSISYLPFFISMVVVAGIIHDFTAQDGVITTLATRFLGLPSNVNLLAKSAFYRSIYIGSDVWQGIGFNSIIYISAISGINPEIYEASVIDGAGRWKQMLHVTLPGLAGTIIILLILQIGSLMSTNLEKVLLLYSPSTYSVSDVISSYVYRQGVVQSQYGLSAAVGLFNSLINFSILLIANMTSRRYTGTSLF
jgi:putative aldouronate transport system permease protein